MFTIELMPKKVMDDALALARKRQAEEDPSSDEEEALPKETEMEKALRIAEEAVRIEKKIRKEERAAKRAKVQGSVVSGVPGGVSSGARPVDKVSAGPVAKEVAAVAVE